MACECGQPKKIPGKNSAYIGKFYFLVRWSYAVEWHDFERSHFFISPCPCPLKGDTEPRQKRLHKLGGSRGQGGGGKMAFSQSRINEIKSASPLVWLSKVNFLKKVLFQYRNFEMSLHQLVKKYCQRSHYKRSKQDHKNV